jgi:hypothetical protein
MVKYEDDMTENRTPARNDPEKHVFDNYGLKNGDLNTRHSAA